MMEKANTYDLSVILPVYNESANLYLLYDELIKNLDIVKSIEIIFVNDGSTDESISIIKSLAKKDNRVKYIDLSRNFGQQIALIAGIHKAQGNRIVIMDCDLQDPPSLIPELYKKMDEGYDVVYAKRSKRKGESIFKTLTAKLFYRILSKLTRCKIPVDTGDFRIISRKVADVLIQMKEQQKFFRGQVAWIGLNQTYVEFERNKRQQGKTGYSVKKMWRFAIDGITSFSDFPLKFATYLGFVVSFVAFVLMMWALYQRFIAKEYVQGWTSLILSILFIGGIQLISLGIIGEYISRIGNNVKDRPLYIIKETNIDEEKK
ncbi:MAG TPA: glycosyltransferase family 2 protein [Bacteroidales bacterium]|jgi:dolichol-phosphate mannosyltransferase|nr:glycosyltransferase family 2 protein [Bacteroidales bacterium]MDY0161074.1 glycosyltransferase family 2 protein [Bacteroidales bacterium]HXK82249.1 glycosyltransferase family 2 protein [Bacteroidales bacterium]